jgi:arsenite-transporting ATPase
MRILLFTGKGGVGKTTTAAATALHCAKLGYKTLIISTDPAHSLSDSLGLKLGAEAEKIADHLWAQELDLYYSMKKYWGNLRDMLLNVFKWQGVNKIVAEELSALPGMEEGSAFLWLHQHYKSGLYDVIIVDSAPTGETLTFLNLPQVTQWWLKKAVPGQKMLMQGFGGMVRMATGVPLDKGLDEMEGMFEKLSEIQKVFSDPKVTSIRLVMNPEKMVIQEAKRAYAFLQMYGYAIDGVVINRVLPQSLEGSFFGDYLEKQDIYLEEIERDFAPLPQFKVPHLGQEVFGFDRLEAIARELYGTKDPVNIFHTESPYQLNEEGSYFVLRLTMPFAEEDEIKVSQQQDQLIISFQNKRRHLFLPKFMAYYHLHHKKMEGQQLQLYFKKKA